MAGGADFAHATSHARHEAPTRRRFFSLTVIKNRTTTRCGRRAENPRLPRRDRAQAVVQLGALARRVGALARSALQRAVAQALGAETSEHIAAAAYRRGESGGRREGIRSHPGWNR